MSLRFRIAVLGLGGVGGFVGGKLAAHALSCGTEIIFLARGENEKAIKSGGLTLVTPLGQSIVHPAIVTSKPDQVGVVDLVICCVKSYDLVSSAATLEPCLGEHTVILPLLNGLDASERVRAVLPQAQVWDGCIYLVSQLTAPGVVTQTGTVNRLIFGSTRAARGHLERINSLFRDAGIDSHLTDNAPGAVWEKYLFLSPIATVTSYLDESIGRVLENDDHKRLLLDLIGELHTIALASGIALPFSIVSDTLEKFKGLPYEAVPSMLTDFRRGSKTEIDALTTYVTKLGREMRIPTPRYDELAGKLILGTASGTSFS